MQGSGDGEGRCVGGWCALCAVTSGSITVSSAATAVFMCDVSDE